MDKTLINYHTKSIAFDKKSISGIKGRSISVKGMLVPKNLSKYDVI